MGEAKPFASLSSGLLARKGQAKPAMRPQGFNGFGQFSGGTADDLGWNDMGYDAPRPPAPQPLGLTPVGLDGAEVSPPPQPVPAVVAQQEALSERLAGETAPVLSVKPRATRPRALPGSKAKAAFTLRLNPDRHLKLRLACAMQNRSAQMLVTEALDRFLDSIPDLEDVADRVPAASNG